METAGAKGAGMRAACLLYHDVVEDNDWESSGFNGPGTAKYKLNRGEFEEHLAAIGKERKTSPGLAHELAQPGDDALRFLLTFDDGGESAATRIAGILERYGWRGHFFVTAGQVGNRGFVDKEQIRSLRRAGHVIGSHSFSHPTRMSHCTKEQLADEWTRSIGTLSEILGEAPDTASVPGGYYSDRVAETAAAAGIRVLFNSEPTTAIRSVDGCLVVGRYNIFRGMSPRVSGELVSVRAGARSRQWLYWNFKKVLKKSAGGPYLAARQWLLREG
jgi:peptidoglycan/xylan/chitin deacetylase (PgdA/CDA1 family)